MDYHLDKDEAINGNEMIDALKRSDHFYITHYCKKRNTIEKRRCFWDSKSKLWGKPSKANLLLLVLL